MELNIENIRETFESIFDGMGIDVLHETSMYYVCLTCYNPSSFLELYRRARKIRRNIPERALRNGRDALLSHGLVAQVLFTHGADVKFGTESYLPVDPKIILQEGEKYLERIYSSEDLALRKKYIDELHRVYIENFGRHGIKIEKGNITLHNSGTWILYALLSIMQRLEKGALSIVLSEMGAFEEPYIRYLLKEGVNIRAIFDRSKEIETAVELKKYGDGIEVRYMPAEHYGTYRQIIFDHELAVDGRKLLPLDRPEPSYISTIYLREEESLALLRQNFESVWNASEIIF